MKRIRLRKPGLIPVAFIVTSTVFLSSLGVWQLQRLQWKNGLIAQLEAAQSRPPVASLPENPDAETYGYRSAELAGTYLYDKTLRVIGRKSGGYLLYTPLQLSDGRLILVNRGWAPSALENTRDQSNGKIKGFLKVPAQKRLFSPPNSPDKNLWFIESVPEMEQSTGLTLYPLIFVVTSPANDDNVPEVYSGEIHLRNDHLGYAITWFSLAAIGVVMFAIYYREPTKI